MANYRLVNAEKFIPSNSKTDMLWDIEKDNLRWYKATFYFHLGDLLSNRD